MLIQYNTIQYNAIQYYCLQGLNRCVPPRRDSQLHAHRGNQWRESEELRDFGVDHVGRGGGGTAVDGLALFVDQELLEVPLWEAGASALSVY